MRPLYLEKDYNLINREERNLTAILYSALCNTNNVNEFLKLIGASSDEQVIGMYYEYSYLRDLWHALTHDTDKLSLIRSKLKFLNGIIFDLNNIQNTNSSLGIANNISSKTIQSPGRWSIAKLNSIYTDRSHEFEECCKFKWSFNIKPDMVIQLSNGKAICIETKFESGESTYPLDKAEKKIFKDRKIQPVKQLEMQMHMMTELLGFDTTFILITDRNIESNSHTKYSWHQIFELLDISFMPDYIQKMVQLKTS